MARAAGKVARAAGKVARTQANDGLEGRGREDPRRVTMKGVRRGATGKGDEWGWRLPSGDLAEERIMTASMNREAGRWLRVADNIDFLDLFRVGGFERPNKKPCFFPISP